MSLMKRKPLIDLMVPPGHLVLVESAEPLPSGKKRGRIMRGPFGFTGKATRNGRTYVDELWENVIADEEISFLMENRLLLGEADHPPGDELESSVVRTSHFQTKLWLDKQKSLLMGELEIVPTACGQIISILVDHGWSPGVSSRGGGEEITRAGNLIINPDNYLYYCHDIVVDPSCGKQARITEGHKAMREVRKLVESRYHTYTSNDGDYDFFDSLLGKFGLKMSVIRESVGDKKKSYSIPLKEADQDVLKKRLAELSEEAGRGSKVAENLISEHEVLLEKYDRLLERNSRLEREKVLVESRLNAKLRATSSNLRAMRVILESKKKEKEGELEPMLGGTTSGCGDQLESEELENEERRLRTKRVVESSRRSSIGRDDFSEISLGGHEHLTESEKPDTARMISILKKRGMGKGTVGRETDKT